MAQYLKAQVRIQGVRPLLFHHFSVKSLPLTKAERTGVAGNDPVEWRRSVLATESGQLYLEPTYIFGCLRDGGKFTQRGRGTLLPTIQACLVVLDDIILIHDRFLPDKLNTPPSSDPSQPVYLDIRGVTNPGTKGRNIRYRVACSPGWTCSFGIMWDSTVINRDEIKAVIIDAGRMVGIGNGRRIGMGKFELLEMNISE
jgi:hypothetical protein